MCKDSTFHSKVNKFIFLYTTRKGGIRPGMTDVILNIMRKVNVPLYLILLSSSKSDTLNNLNLLRETHT